MLRLTTLSRQTPGNGLIGTDKGFVLPFTDDFSSIKPQWYGPSWTVSGGVVTNTPATAGNEMVTDGDMETVGVGSWNDNVTPTTKEKSSVQKHGGNQSLHIITDASSEGAYQNLVTSAGTWYKFSGWIYRATTNAYFRVTGGGFSDLVGSNTSTTWEKKTITGRANGPQITVQLLSSTSEAYGDDYSVFALSLSSLFRTIRTKKSSVTAQCTIPTYPSDTVTKPQVGLVINVDNPITPTNCVIAYLNRRDNRAYMDKCVNGVWTNMVNGAITYGVAKILKVVKNGTLYQLFYDGTQIGTNQTLTAMNGTVHGLFSTNEESAIDNYSLIATPIDGNTGIEPGEGIFVANIAWTSDEHVGHTVPYAAGSPGAFFNGLAGLNPDYYVSTGDTVLYPVEDEFDLYDTVVAAITCDHYNVPGNHEEDNWTEAPTWVKWDAHHIARHFSFDVGPFRFIGVHTRAGRSPDAEGKCRIDEGELTWFQGQLASLGGQKPVVFSHYQPYDILGNDVLTICQNAGVKLWLSGHGHRDMISSTSQSVQIITGPTTSGTGTYQNTTGGFGWIEVYNDRLVIRYRYAIAPWNEVSTSIYTPITFNQWD